MMKLAPSSAVSSVFRAFRQKWKFLLLGLLFCCNTQQARADHNMGSDISYRCLGNGQYEVTITYYRDCSGIPAPSSLFLDINSASGCGTAPSVTLNQVASESGIDVSQLCTPQLPFSTCQGGNLPGVEVYVYRSTITLPSECSDWIISYSDCCRNVAVTNLSGFPGGQGIYLQALINNTNGLCNNSPTFTTRPVPYICAGQPFVYNHGAIDSDGDSLFFTVIEPRENGNTIIPYAAGFSISCPLSTAPVNTFAINPLTGEMSFTPNGAQQAVVGILVTEVRNGDTIGQTMRDMQIVVLSGCTNMAPVPDNTPVVVSGGAYDSLTHSFIVCSNNQLIFSFGVRDPDVNDTLEIDAANTNLLQVFGMGNFTLIPDYPNAPTSYDTMTVYVIINAIPANLGNNRFVVGVTDDACPIRSTRVLGFNVVIPGVEIQATDTTICPGIAQTLQLTAHTFTSSINSTVPGTFSWQQIAGPTAPLSSTTVSSPSIAVPNTTVDGQTLSYVVTFTTVPDTNTGLQCVTDDTIDIHIVALPLNVSIAISDSVLCQNGAPNLINFNTTISGPGVDSINGIYTWTTLPASHNTDYSVNNIPNPSASSSGGAGDSIRYIAQYAYGACIGRDTVTAHFGPGVIIMNPAVDTICAGDTIQISAHLSDTVILALPVVCTDYVVETIPFAPIPGMGASAGVVNDDILSAPLPIGFNFRFMCSTYNQFLVSSNGFITFDFASFNSGCCSGGVLPDPFDVNNVIAFAWNDLYPPASTVPANSITFRTVGTAPNRICIIEFNDLQHFPGSPGSVNTGQILLYETTNVIEIHSTVVSDDGSVHTQGIEDSTGTFGYPAPGCNSTNFVLNNQAFRWSPAITQISFPLTYQWSPSLLVSDDTLYNPLTHPQQTTTYYVTVSEGTCAQEDSVKITVLTNLPAPTVSCDSTIVSNTHSELGFTWTSVVGATGWEYSLDSGRTWIALPLAQQSVVVSNVPSNSCMEVYVRATGGTGPCPRNASASASCCVTPCALGLSGFSVTQPSCNANNGVITVNLTNATNPVFTWSSNANGQTTATITGLAEGVYQVSVEDASACLVTSAATITAAGVSVTVASSQDTIVCFGDASGFVNINATGTGGNPLSYNWSNGATTQNLANLNGGVYTVTVSQQVGALTCTDTTSVTIAEPSAALDITATLLQDLDCSGLNIAQIGTTSAGGWNGYTYTWSNGGATASLTGLGAGTYTVTLTDAQGCQDVATINIAQPIAVSLNATIGTTAVSAITVTQDASNTLPLSAGTAQTGVSYVWTPNTNIANPNVANTVVGVPTAGTFVYVVTGLSTDSCVAVDSVLLTVIEVSFGGMPTAFSPNGDGDNETFRPVAASNLDVSCFRVYNRWGQLLYDNPSSYQTGWDGKFNGSEQPRDVYIYEFCYQLPGQETKALRGEFTLVR